MLLWDQLFKVKPLKLHVLTSNGNHLKPSTKELKHYIPFYWVGEEFGKIKCTQRVYDKVI